MVNQGEFIVVAGGVENFESEANGGSTNAELLQLSTLTWHKIKALPKPFFGAVAARLDPGAPQGSDGFGSPNFELVERKLNANFLQFPPIFGRF